MQTGSIHPLEWTALAVTAVAVVGAIVAVVVYVVLGRPREGIWMHELAWVDGVPFRDTPFLVLVMPVVILRPMLLRLESFHSVPAGLIFAGMDLSICAAAWLVALYYALQSFQARWSRGLMLQQVRLFVIAAWMSVYVWQDIAAHSSTPWIWFVAALEACFLTPLLARWAYTDLLTATEAPDAQRAES